MLTTESVTFYDRHPFDWTPADDSAEMNSVVSSSSPTLLRVWIQTRWCWISVAVGGAFLVFLSLCTKAVAQTLACAATPLPGLPG